MSLELVEKTWEEVGCRVRPLRDTVYLRTELLPEFIGSICIPATMRGNYSNLPHTVFMHATVLSVGPECRVLKVGDRVGFSRLFFARWKQMEDGTLVGWVTTEKNIYCLVEEEERRD